MDKAHAQAAISRSHCAPPFAFQRHSFTGQHPADAAESDEGEVIHRRAKMVREALASIRDEAGNINTAIGADLLIAHADDETLARLGRLIR